MRNIWRPFTTRKCLRNWVCTFAGLVATAEVVLPSNVQAFTSVDADTIFFAYNKGFYSSSTNGGFYQATTEGGKSSFWMRAEQIEMVLDVYERTRDVKCLSMISNLFDRFVADYGTNWKKDEFNDDIMWMVIASARAYQLTGDTNFRAVARTNFDLCYARAWSTNMGGGLWWTTSDFSKNACVNGPGAIAAFLLYQSFTDTNYLAKAQSLYKWERAHLFDTRSGCVFDSINAGGKINHQVFTYNQGTFVGAANFLDYTNDAELAADYTRDILCQHEILPGYDQNGDAAGFNGICARWIAKFMKDRQRQAAYQKWLQTNAEMAWHHRRVIDNLAWSLWSLPTPAYPLNSWACSSSVVVMQVVPPTQEHK